MLVTLCGEAGLGGAAAGRVQLKVSRDEQHRLQPLSGAFEIPAARDDPGDRGDFAPRAGERDGAVLRPVGVVPAAHFDRAVFSLLHARLDDVLERLDRGGAYLGRALVRADVRDRAEADALLVAF